MSKIWTLGHPSKRTQFRYYGSVETEVTIHFMMEQVIPSRLFKEILMEFRGRTIPGGFSMTDPTPGGLGEWVANHAEPLIGTRLTPRHASFIAAILVHEGKIRSSLKGNAVMLHFGAA